MEEDPKIRVVIRKRPLTRKEQARKQQDIVQVRDGKTVVVSEMKEKVDMTKFLDQHIFTFDNAYDQGSDNFTIYQDCVRPIVHSAFQGARVTCFAYGQTGSGKTYTMNGDPTNRVPGLYILAAHDLFGIRQDHFRNLTILMSFYEIYCGKLFDLLNGRNFLQIRQDSKQNVNVIGLTEKNVKSIQDFMDIIEAGTAVRVTSQNSTNVDSSRSHAILQITLMDGKKIHGKVSFIDLAGCQRGADTIDQSKQTRVDGAQINKSLLALKQCIRALDNGKSHTPFRGSKLTMVLKDSLTGFCKTLMIGNISPNSGSCQNTLNTLRYADRVKQLRKAGGQMLSRQDQKAKQLMLPRMQKNKQTTYMSEDDDDEALFPATRRLESNYSTNNRMEDQMKFANRASLHMKSRTNCMEQQTQNLNTNRVVGRTDKQTKNRALNQSLPNVTTRNMRHSAPLTMGQPLGQVDINRPLDQSEQDLLEQTIEQFRCWQPRGHSSLPTMQSRLDTLSQLMRRQEHELTELHKNQIQFQHDTFHTNLQIYNEVSLHDKSSTDLMKYSSYLEQFIDRKIQILFNLKNKVQTFSSHVKDHHDCQLKYQQATQLRQEDEVSLLDQVHEIEQQLFRPQSNQQPYYFNSLQRQSDQRVPTHHHNTRYSMNANMMRANGGEASYRPTHESLFNGSYNRGY